MVKVKICGITNRKDALTAIEAGADALGFVFYSASPRHVSPEQAAEIIRNLPPFVQTVGLFVNENSATVNSIADQCGLDIIQLHGEETPEYCEYIRRRILKAFRVRDTAILDALPKYRVAGYLLDAWSPVALGGTGLTFNWDIAAEAVHRGERIVLAGGLTPENIAESIRQVRPFGVDVSSGVESAPGLKDAALVRRFVASAKLAA